MTDIKHRNIARTRLLGLVPRHTLDAILGTDKRPWNMARQDLVWYIVEAWDDDTQEKVRKAIDSLFDEAR
jgi:hypothetical protein